MQLRRLQGLEREKLEAEYAELEKKITWYQEVLADNEKVKGILREELTDIRDKFGDERFTEIQEIEDEIDIEDLIDEEESVYTLTHAGYIKRVPADTYRAQNRGGKGISAQSLRDEDFVETIITGSTHDYLFFHHFGKCHRKMAINPRGRTRRQGRTS
jgi:DNA gyrase subunit A